MTIKRKKNFHKDYSFLSPNTNIMNAPINGDKRIDIAKKPPNERPLFLAPLATTKDKIS